MKQVLQDMQKGAVIVTETPDPTPAPGRLLVRVQASLLSAGTESAQVAKGRQSLLERVRQKPELIQKGLAELRERGLSGVKDKLASKFTGYAELGYSCAGTVVHSVEGDGVPGSGTLVSCAGAGIANHSEFVSVPQLLTAVVPTGVSAEAAAYTTVGAIAMQGVRQSGAQLGEYVAVIGLGLVGLLTAQLLKATGCRVAGIDPSPNAQRHGLANGCDVVTGPDQALEAMLGISGGSGADAIIICAATRESSPVELAGKLARSRARVVMVGATGMTIPREEYFLKELSFTLSRSYGPGRYDRGYEEEGKDYPLDYVRFTEQRNMRSFLELTKSGSIDPTRLTTHRFAMEEAPAAYALLNEPGADRVGILLTYAHSPAVPACFNIRTASPRPVSGNMVGVGFIGAGAYAQGMLLPMFKGRTDVVLRRVSTRAGSHALHVSRRFGFESIGTRVEDVIEDPAIQVIFITTRHDSHANLTSRALRAGKHVWVEKPLALSVEELREVTLALRENPSGRLVVGFNRPFSPSAEWLLKRMAPSTPRMMHYRVNAGFVSPDSWIHDPKSGGGRLLGEGCHFFDFLRHTAGSPADSVMVEALDLSRSDLPGSSNFAATIRFANGSIGQLLYSAQGAPAMGKEHFECFAGSTCAVLHDFRDAEFFNQDRREHLGKHQQNKGQAALLDRFLCSLRTGEQAPMLVEDILESSVLTLAAQQSLIEGRPVKVANVRKLVA